MAQHFALVVTEWNAEIALNPPVEERCIFRKLLLDAVWVMAQTSANHILAGSSGQIVFDVVANFVAEPERERAHPRVYFRKFGDKGKGDISRRSQLPRERLEKLFSRSASRAFEDRTQNAQLVLFLN